jgi:hypothetical protein
MALLKRSILHSQTYLNQETHIKNEYCIKSEKLDAKKRNENRLR